MPIWRSTLQLCAGQIRTQAHAVYDQCDIDIVVGPDGNGQHRGQRDYVYSTIGGEIFDW